MAIRARLRVTTPILSGIAEQGDESDIRLDDHCAFTSGEIGIRFWASPTDAEAFAEGLEADETVAAYEVLTRGLARTLYQVHLSDAGREKSFIPLLGEFGGELLDGERAHGEWLIQLRFPDRESLQGFFDTFDAHSAVSVTLDKLHREDSLDSRSFGLTPSQREALQTACEQGYFEVPRKATLKSLSDELNVSDQAVSERLRRAQKRVCDRIFEER